MYLYIFCSCYRATPKLSECLEKKRHVLEQIEIKLDSGIDRALETIAGWVKIVLQLEHNKKEFFKSETFNDNENLNTVSPVSSPFLTKLLNYFNQTME